MKIAFFESSNGKVGFQYVGDDQETPDDWLVLDPEEAKEVVPTWGADRVWDRVLGSPRAVREAEKLPAAKAAQESLVRDAANTESETQVRAFEARIVVGKWARNLSLSAEEQAIFNAENARYNKLVGLVTQIRNATSVSQVQSIVW